jgi:hypothetical protein
LGSGGEIEGRRFEEEEVGWRLGSGGEVEG